MIRLVLVFFVLIVFVGCGKNQSLRDSKKHVEVSQNMLDGNYRAILRPINFYVNGFFAYGNAELNLKKNTLTVVTYLDDDAPVTHLQSIHKGKRCPSLSDDINQDGVIDIKEAYAVTGEVLVPLDGDLSSHEEGSGVYPKGSSFTYKRNVYFSDLMREIGRNISLESRVVMIHGTAVKSFIPLTAQTMLNIPVHLSIPIVCGIIQFRSP